MVREHKSWITRPGHHCNDSVSRARTLVYLLPVLVMDKNKLRFISVFILAALLLATVVALRPSTDSGITKTLFWRHKLEADAIHSIVAVGDSRVLHGIAPELFADEGIEPGLNLGFRGAALNEKLMKFAQSRLKEQGQRILLVGVTPNSFTPNANQSNGFEQEQKNLSAAAFRFPGWLAKIVDQLQPSSLKEVKRIVAGKTKAKSECFHETGWIDTTHKSANEKEALRFFEHRFDQNEADPERVRQFHSMVKQFSDNGIVVACFRPPVTKEMAQLEDQRSGFDYIEFRNNLKEAGGVWLDASDSELVSYDGSHLDGESARKLSANLAAQIKQHLDDKLQ